MPEQTRSEHLAWCKARALAYLADDDVRNALASMFSDLGKHPETKGHAGIKLGMTMMWCGHLQDRIRVQKFIQGFN